MLITKEHLDQITDNYSRTHNTFEVMGFVDGLITLLQIIEDKSKKNEKETN